MTKKHSISWHQLELYQMSSRMNDLQKEITQLQQKFHEMKENYDIYQKQIEYAESNGITKFDRWTFFIKQV